MFYLKKNNGNEYEDFKKINVNVSNKPIQNFNLNSNQNFNPINQIRVYPNRSPSEQLYDNMKYSRNNDLEIFKELQGGYIIDNKPYYYSKKTF